MLLDALTGWVLFGGLVLTIGAVAARWWIIPRAVTGRDVAEAGIRGLSGRAATLGLAGALLILVGLTLYLVRQLGEFRDPFVPVSEDLDLLLSTSWGSTWKAASVASVVLVVTMAIARSGRSAGWWIASPLAVGLASFPAFTGHAAGMEEGRTLALAADTLHVWAAGAWMGGLAAVLYLESRRRTIANDRGASLLPALVPAFSPVAVASVVVLVGSGLYASWVHLAGISALVTTTYGRLLLLKLGIVAVVLGFGARNFRVLTPGLGTDAGNGAMRRSAATEFAVAQAVLIVTALLVRTSPMGH